MRIPIESLHIDSAVNFDTRQRSSKQFLSIEARRSPIVTNITSILLIFKFKQFKNTSTFCMPHVPFAFEFESERANGILATKHLLNYHSSDLEKSVQQPNDNLVTVFRGIAIRPFRLIRKRKRKLRYFQKHK